MGMYLSLMGYFNISTPILTIGSTFGSESSLMSLVPIYTMYLEDPWTLPSLSTSDEYPIPTKMGMPFSTMVISYQSTLGLIVDPSPSSSQMEEEDSFAQPSWAVASSHSHDFFNDTFPSDEANIEEG